MLSRVLLSHKLRLASIGMVGTLFVSTILPTAAAFAAQGTAHNKNIITASDVNNALSHNSGLLNTSGQTSTTSDSHTALKAAVSGATVTIPKTASSGVTLGAANGPQLNIQLPNANQSDTASIIANGVVAYAGNNGSANAVQTTSDGVRMLTIIDSSSAPTEYDYRVTVPTGGHIALTSAGGATVVDTNDKIIASVAAPWATDANGKTIQTYFTTDGAILTQHILHNIPGVTYPVTADPSISWGWNLYVNFNWWETQNIEHFQEAGYAGWGLAAIVCSKIPYWPAQAACTAVTVIKGAQLAWAVRNAQASNSCLQLAIPYPVLNNPWGLWYLPWFGWARC